MSRRDIKADICVIGAGSGGLSVAAGAAQLGLSTVLFEKGEMGGDCLNYGCVPSKALIAAAEAAQGARDAGRLGVTAGPVEVDFAAVMAHVHKTIETIAPIDSQERFEGLGVTVIREAAQFENDRAVGSESVRVTARKFVIATGSHAAIPPIPGLDQVPYLTNETVFGLKALPKRLIVLGGGPIGVELGQAIRRLGSEVVIIEAGALLPREDPACAAVVAEQLAADGVEVLTGAPATAVETGPVVVVGEGASARRVQGTHLLIAVGRQPAIGGLNLEAAGIAYTKAGITTRRDLRTTNPRVFAVGDAAGRGQFTHLAGAHAGLVVRRAIFGLPVNADGLVVPRVTYCDPEVASVGLTEAEARKAQGGAVRVETFPFHDNDRAQAEGDGRGFGKLILTKSGKILGATLVGRHAGDQIHIWSLALSGGVKLGAFTGMIAPYPTRGEIAKRLAGQFYTPTLFSDRTRKLVSVLKRFA
jgi:pyruvate/2-oxoglutarate dehydrogenase complex dihydrolipoamide dehydrogenase (E3) component